MPALDVADAPINEDPGPINPVVGIIYPPPEVRNIVDKTASFVARNGPEFEARIRQNELNNPKFDFLNTGNPYHSYYLQKVQDFGNGEDIEKSNTTSKFLVHSAAQKQQEILNKVEQPFVPKDPPAEFEFIADPPSISALDLDIVKLTAQFVARNGKIFLTKLMNKEHRNIQFDFLRPQHSLFQYFTKLLEQYTKILIPPKSMTLTLRDEIKSPEHVLDQVKYRVQWQKYEETQRAKEEEILERERISYAQIDWHDFVVVELVDYQPFEVGNFPPLTTPEEVGARVLIQERIDDLEDIEMEMESDEDSSSDTEMMQDKTEEGKKNDSDNVKEKTKDSDKNNASISEETSTPTIQPLLPPVPGKVVVKQYDPKQAIQVSRPKVHDEYLVSPITGEKIPASKVQEHMRIGLLDPRWVEQHGQRTADKRNQEIVYAEGTAIDASLKLLAERRTDIFGVGDEETAIGKKIGEEDVRKDEKATWDGCMSSVEAATRAARANVTLEEQIHQIHKVKGLLPDERKEKIGPKNDMVQMKQHQVQPQQQPKPPVPVMPPQAPPRFIMPLPPPSMIPQPPVMMMTDPLMGMPQPPLMTLPPQPNFMPPVSMPTKHPSEMPIEEEPTNKRMRNEDSLIPESVFLSKNPSPVPIKVIIPVVQDKSEWKLNGQTINYTLPLGESVANLKTMLQKEIGMVPSKQKLFYDGMFFKDSNTLAYYNITPGSVIQLQVKERGGRKK